MYQRNVGARILFDGVHRCFTTGSLHRLQTTGNQRTSPGPCDTDNAMTLWSELSQDQTLFGMLTSCHLKANQRELGIWPTPH